MQIPNALKRAHVDGRTVIFCGAGVSAPAGLPTFWGLAEAAISTFVGTVDSPSSGALEREVRRALEADQLDWAFEVLEEIIDSDKKSKEERHVRTFVAETLSKKPRTLKAHATLASLAKLDDGGRLVTTNFDQFFEKALNSRRYFSSKWKKKVSIGPQLPLANQENLHGLVYLHGRMETEEEDGHLDNNKCVLSRADFGAAYIYDSWAAKFVIDLFRYFNVVFLGYSLQDPIMQYLVSGIKTAKRRAAQNNDVHFLDAYWFVSVDGKSVAEIEDAVGLADASGLIAVPYKPQDKRHSNFWVALEKWSEEYRLGFDEKRQVVLRTMRAGVDPEDQETIKAVVWALEDETVSRILKDPTAEGVASNSTIEEKRFPDTSWLEALSNEGFFNWIYKERNSSKEGRANTSGAASGQLFAPLIGAFEYRLDLHPSVFNLLNWISSCVEDPKLLNLVLRNGAVMHSRLRFFVSRRMRSDEPNIAPGLKAIWSFLTDDNYAHQLSEVNARLDRMRSFSVGDGASYARFITALTPIAVFRPRSSLDSFYEAEQGTEFASNFAKVDVLALGFEDRWSLEQVTKDSADWDRISCDLALDITFKLNEALRLQNALIDPSSLRATYSVWVKPLNEEPTVPHDGIWFQLIYILRDLVDAHIVLEELAKLDRLVETWLSLEHDIFYRLALYAMAGGKNEQ